MGASPDQRAAPFDLRGRCRLILPKEKPAERVIAGGHWRFLMPDTYESNTRASQAAESWDFFDDPTPALGVPKSLPEILIEAGELPALATAGELALLRAGAPIFQRGGALVRPATFLVRASGARTALAVGLRAITTTGMVDHLARAADWRRPSIKAPPLQACRSARRNCERHPEPRRRMAPEESGRRDHGPLPPR